MPLTITRRPLPRIWSTKTFYSTAAGHLTDITYLYYQKPLGTDKVFYLCVFKDAFTSEILGHSTSERMDISLVREAYEMMMNLHGDELQAVKQKGLAVLIHSDQGASTCPQPSDGCCLMTSLFSPVRDAAIPRTTLRAKVSSRS